MTAAIVFHVLLVVAFVSSHLHRPDHTGIERTVFVSLLDSVTVPPAIKPRLASVEPAAAAAKANAVRTRTASGSAHQLQRDNKVVAEGREAPGPGTVAVAAIPAPAIDTVGSGVADSQSTNGTGVANGPRFRPARVQHRSMIRYRSEAFVAHQERAVDVIVDITTDGIPVEAHVYHSSGSTTLDEAAVAGVLKWTFRAAERNGVPTQAQAIVTIDWAIGPAIIEHFAQLGIPSTGAAQNQTANKRDCLLMKQPDLCKDLDDQRRSR
jgi:TonB family protein